MASITTSGASTKNAASENTSKKSQEKESREEINAGKRGHDYVPSNLQPKGRLLRIQTQESITRSVPGRVIKEGEECEKPVSEPNRGCRTGRMGFWVETDEGEKVVSVCKRKVCDWQ